MDNVEMKVDFDKSVDIANVMIKDINERIEEMPEDINMAEIALGFLIAVNHLENELLGEELGTRIPLNWSLKALTKAYEVMIENDSKEKEKGE